MAARVCRRHHCFAINLVWPLAHGDVASAAPRLHLWKHTLRARPQRNRCGFYLQIWQIKSTKDCNSCQVDLILQISSMEKLACCRFLNPQHARFAANSYHRFRQSRICCSKYAVKSLCGPSLIVTSTPFLESKGQSIIKRTQHKADPGKSRGKESPKYMTI